MTELLFGQNAVVGLGGTFSGDGSVHPLKSVTAAIDCYPNGIVTCFHPDSSSQYYLQVTNNNATGADITATVTVNGQNETGTALTAKTFSCVLHPQPAAEVADTITLGPPNAPSPFPNNPDPGSGSISVV